MAGMTSRRSLGTLLLFAILVIPAVCSALPGDIDHSGRVDGYDLILFARAMGATAGDTAWLADADLDGNGTVDQDDLAILSAHFGRTGAAFGVWAALYDSSYRHRAIRLAEDARLLATSPELSSRIRQFAGNPRDGTVWALTTDKTLILLSPTNDTILKIITNTNATALAVNPDDQSLWLCVPTGGRIIRVAPTVPATYDLASDSGHHRTYTGFSTPLALDVDGRTNTVWVIDSSGSTLVRLRGDAPDGYDLASDSGSHRRIPTDLQPALLQVNQGDSSVWLASSSRLQRIDPTGRTVLVDLAIFTSISAIAPNPMDGSVAVADSQRKTVRRIGPDGAVFFETAPLSNVQDLGGIAVNPLDASMWVTISAEDRIVHLAANGTQLAENTNLGNIMEPIALIPAGGDANRIPSALALADRTNVEVGQQIHFTGIGTDNDGTIVRYRWDFDGDGTFDATATDTGDAVHAYPATGIFTPVFEVMDNDHLVATDHRLVIRVGKLTAKATADPLTGEAPLQVEFDGSFTDPLNGRVDSFQWDFDGDGIFDFYSDTSPATLHTYPREGTYTAVLKVTDGPHSATDSLTVTVTRSLPVVQAKAAPYSGTAPLDVALDADARDPDGTIVLYQWDFDDDGTVDWTSTTSPAASHLFTTPGDHTARLTVTDDDGQQSSDTVTVSVTPPLPVATATATPDTGHAPLTVDFSAAGSTAAAGSIASYEWDFGDCTVLLRDDAENGIGNWTADPPWGITDQDAFSSNHAFTDSPNADYAANTSLALTLATPIDPGTATQATLSFRHRYSLGSYTYLYVEVSTDGGTVWSGAAAFSYYPPLSDWTKATVDLSPFLPADQLQVRFRIQSSRYPDDGWYVDDIQITSCADNWTPGTGPTASHTYATAGDFTARLRVTDNLGQQATATVPVRVLPAILPTAAISANPTSGVAPLAVTLTPTVTAPASTVASLTWDFGEDLVWTATRQAASRLWSLTGRQLATSPAYRYIEAIAADPGDNSLWLVDSSTHAVLHVGPDGTELDRIAQSNPYDLAVDNDTVWVLRPSGVSRFRKSGERIMAVEGLYYRPTAMRLDQDAGVLWVLERTPDRVTRIDTSAPDGYDVGSATGHHRTVTGFNDPAALTVAPDHSLWVADAGSREIIHLAADGTVLARVAASAGLRAIAAASGRVWCATATTLVSLDPAVADGYDLSTDTGSHTTITGFTAIGQLAVDPTTDTLWVLDTSARRLVRIAANGTVAGSLPIPDNTIVAAIRNRGATNTATTTTADPVTHTFTMPGVFPVRMTVQDSNGRTTTAELDITVAAPPTVDLTAAPASGPAPLTVTMTPTAADQDGRIVRFAWDFDGDGAADLETSSATPVNHTYATAGTYTASLRVTDDDGNTATTTATVTVDQSPPQMTASATPLAGHAPLTVQFTATATDPDDTATPAIAWDFDSDGNTDATTATASHTFTTAGTKRILVTATDPDGNTAQQELAVEVLPAGAPWPVLQVVPDTAVTGQQVMICAGGVDPNDTITEAALDIDGDGTFEHTAQAPFTALADDFELDSGLWTADTPWTRSSEAAASGRFAYTDSPGADYTDSEDASLTSATIDLSAAAAPWLRFHHRYEFQYGDAGYVEISTDSGSNWTRLATYTNGSSDWQAVAIDLRAYAGQPAVRLRFHLVSNSSDTADGWQIDDVFLGDCLPFTPATPALLAPVLRLTDAANNRTSRTASLRVDDPRAASRIWVADTYNDLIREYRADGTQLRRIGGFRRPRMVTQDPATGTIWVADTDNNRVVRLAGSVQSGQRVGATAVADTSPSGAGGFLAGDAAYGAGKLNSGVVLDGNGDYVQIDDRPTFHPPSFTIEAWVYPTAAGSTRIIAGKVSQAKDFALALNNGVPAALVYDYRRRYVQPADPLPLNTWTHLAMTYDNAAGRVILYVNGTEAARGDWRADTSNTDPFTIGRSYCCSEYFAGTIDEVRFWSTARTAAEIDAAKDAELTGNESGLIGYWRLDNDPGNVTTAGNFSQPYFLAVAADHSVWVTDYRNGQVVHLTADGTTELDRISGFSAPHGITVARDNTVWVADHANDQVVQLDPNTGNELRRISGFSRPIMLRQAPDGGFWVTDYNSSRVLRLAADGGYLLGRGGFANPVGVDVHQASGFAWVTDYANNEVVLLDQKGNEILRRSGFNRPHHLGCDQGDGSAWVADLYNNRVVHLMPDGTISRTIAGLRQPLYVTVVQPAAADPTLSPPTATAVATPASGAAPLTVAFSGSATDADGTVTEYAWDFDGNGSFDATGATQSHTYTQPGIHHVILRVRDNDGLYGYASQTVRVTPFAIRATASPLTGNAPLTVSFDGSSTSIPAGRRIVAWQWDFDADGIADFTSPVSPRTSHRLSATGTHTAILTAIDDQGGRASATVTVTVANSPPRVSNYASPASGDPPLLVHLTGTASDANGSVVLYRWDFNGDGVDDWISQELGTWFLYRTPGTYETVLTAVDDEGGTASASKTVTVNTVHAPPTVTVEASPPVGQAPLAVTLTGTASDADGTVTAWSWDLDGDGAADATTQGPHSHTFTEPGTYRVTATVTDNDGQQTTARALVTVLPAGTPVARIQATPQAGPLPLEVAFDGSGSTDPDGSIASYRWHFGDRDTLWILSSGDNRAYRYQGLLRQAEFTGMYVPSRMVLDTDGTVWVSDRYHDQVVKLARDRAAEILRVDGFNDPIGMALDPRDRSLWVADFYNNQVVHLDRDGQEIGRFSGFNRPIDLAVLPDDGSVWVVEYSGNKLVHLAADGTRLAEVPGLSQPVRIRRDAANDALWISDRGNHRLVRLPADTPTGTHATQTSRQTTTVPGGAKVLLYNDAAAASGKMGNAVALDGNGDYLLIPASPALDVQSFTVEAWIKPAAATSAPTIFMRGDNSGYNEIYLGLTNASTVDTALDNRTYRFSGSTDLLDGNWHHVALVFDQAAGTLTCYVDGTVYGTPQNVTATLDFGASHALIGADFDRFNSGLGNYFNGLIDEVRLWNTARSAAEINAAMNTPIAGTEPGLAAAWPLDTLTAFPALRITGLTDLGALAVDQARQRVWVCAPGLDAVLAFHTGTGREITRLTGIRTPAAVAVEPESGAVWIGDQTSDTVRLYTPEGEVASSIPDIRDPSDLLLVPTEATVTAGPTARHTYPDTGHYLATLTVTDDSGQKASASLTVRAGNGPEAVPIAYPTAGVAPLTVRFVTSGRGPEGTIETFAWDFDGNGSFDWSNPIPETTTHTYGAPGTYQATLRVTDNQGRTDTKAVTITVAAPASGPGASILAEPVMGEAPLTSHLTALARSPSSFVTGYAWDTDGDNTFETTGSRTTITLTGPESRTVRLRVTDADGNTADAETTLTAVAAGTPIPRASASPNAGPASLEVTFSGSATDSDGTITEYAWDFDGDGTFDHTSATSGDAVHAYHTPGTYNAVFRVTDNDNNTAELTVPVTVTAGITAVLDRDQFDPSAGESVTIASTLTGRATVTIRITDRNGATLRTLVRDAGRPAGFYQDTWDGKDDHGRTVGTGVYLYVIDYTVDGTTYHYDLTNTASPEVNKITPQYPSVFNPFSAETNFFRYTLDTKSEVTIYMSPFVTGALNRAKTLQLRSPRRAGSYVQTWDGTDDLGDLVRPMNYVIAVFAWELPPNAIIVENRPVIGDLHVTPAALNPAASPYDDATSAAILFSLSKPAAVTARILDEENYRVRTLSVQGRAGTGNELVWDGTNSAGDLVAPGIYRVQLTATDDLGHRSEPANTVLIIFY